MRLTSILSFLALTITLPFTLANQYHEDDGFKLYTRSIDDYDVAIAQLQVRNQILARELALEKRRKGGRRQVRCKSDGSCPNQWNSSCFDGKEQKSC